MFRFPSEPDFEGRWKAEVKNGDKFFILMTGTNMENFPVSKDDSVNIARFETTVKKGGISCWSGGCLPKWRGHQTRKRLSSAHLSSSPPTLATDKAVNLREVELELHCCTCRRRQAVHYRSSSPRLPKATSTPTAGSAPGANSALTIKYQDTEQSKSRGQTIKNLRN